MDNSNNSAPGPDGIPYACWRKLKEVGLEILWDALEEIQAAEGKTNLDRAHLLCHGGPHNFNDATLICLPKNPTGTDPEHGTFFSPEATRPLSIVNTDNRLMASAIRIRLERVVTRWITRAQKGFLKGRSMLSNVVSIDAISVAVALQNPRAATILLDFKAAFVSISHEF